MSLFALLLGGPMDLLIIGLIVLLLFGARLPTVMRSLGQSVTEFKKGLEGVPEDGSSRKLDQPKKVDDQPEKS
jgi:sec-independent protein translocase protein TatA